MEFHFNKLQGKLNKNFIILLTVVISHSVIILNLSFWILIKLGICLYVNGKSSLKCALTH